MKKVYLEHYCWKCKVGMKMVLINATIICPKCGTMVYKKLDGTS